MNFHFFVVEIVSSTFNFILFYSMQLGIDRLVLILIVIYLLRKDNQATFTPVKENDAANTPRMICMCSLLHEQEMCDNATL